MKWRKRQVDNATTVFLKNVGYLNKFFSFTRRQPIQCWLQKHYGHPALGEVKKRDPSSEIVFNRVNIELRERGGPGRYLWETDH